jgi:hypothetical protein
VINIKRFLRTASLLAFSVLSVACSKEDRTDYCKNHYLFHADHQDTLGKLEVQIDDEGLVQTRFFIPSSVFDSDLAATNDSLDQLAATLKNGQILLSTDTESTCAPGEVIIQQDSSGLRANIDSICGESNRIKQMDVTLLDLIPELEEVEVEVTTPATFKRFAISRQCANPIFRLELPGNTNEQK